jgi:TolB protein
MYNKLSFFLFLRVWFPHPSPDNKWIDCISYTTDEKQNHPFVKNIKRRLMDIKTKTFEDITPVFFCGAGTINTPSWSPDSLKVAFVSYSVK